MTHTHTVNTLSKQDSEMRKTSFTIPENVSQALFKPTAGTTIAHTFIHYCDTLKERDLNGLTVTHIPSSTPQYKTSTKVNRNKNTFICSIP